jgi:hypothetical protein
VIDRDEEPQRVGTGRTRNAIQRAREARALLTSGDAVNDER